MSYDSGPIQVSSKFCLKLCMCCPHLLPQFISVSLRIFSITLLQCPVHHCSKFCSWITVCALLIIITLVPLGGESDSLCHLVWIPIKNFVIAQASAEVVFLALVSLSMCLLPRSQFLSHYYSCPQTLNSFFQGKDDSQMCQDFDLRLVTENRQTKNWGMGIFSLPAYKKHLFQLLGSCRPVIYL